MSDHEPTRQALQALKPVETWHQDDVDPDLWHHESGIIVNTPALEERASYYRVVRLGVGTPLASDGGDRLGAGA